jgi:hypothetical protein
MGLSHLVDLEYLCYQLGKILELLDILEDLEGRLVRFLVHQHYPEVLEDRLAMNLGFLEHLDFRELLLVMVLVPQ